MARCAITNVSLKDIPNIIKEFQRLNYEVCVSKRFKHEPTSSYFYIAIQLDKCIMRLNSHVGTVRTQITNTQNMNNSDMSTQKTPNLHVCSTQ